MFHPAVVPAAENLFSLHRPVVLVSLGCVADTQGRKLEEEQRRAQPSSALNPV